MRPSRCCPASSASEHEPRMTTDQARLARFPGGPLAPAPGPTPCRPPGRTARPTDRITERRTQGSKDAMPSPVSPAPSDHHGEFTPDDRSEERRVGKEDSARRRRVQYITKKKQKIAKTQTT